MSRYAVNVISKFQNDQSKINLLFSFLVFFKLSLNDLLIRLTILFKYIATDAPYVAEYKAMRDVGLDGLLIWKFVAWLLK